MRDVQRRPISGVQIGLEGDGGSSVTADDGKARITLAKQTKAGTWAFLQILKSPPGKDLVLVSPWDYKVLIPSFENETENFQDIVVVQRGDRSALESGTILAAAVAQINNANNPRTLGGRKVQEDPRANLLAVAKHYGLDPDALEQAILAWGARTTDPYEAGLAALFAHDYANASTELEKSLEVREKNLATDQKAAADAAFFLGQARWEEGKYQDSVVAYKRCLQLRPDDTATMNRVVVALTSAGEYAAATILAKQVVAMRETEYGVNSPAVAEGLLNLADLLKIKGDYANAVPQYERALAIWKSAFGPNHYDVALVLNNFGELQHRSGHFAAAEQLYRQALDITQAIYPDSLLMGALISNLGSILQEEGDDDSPVAMYEHAQAIFEKREGPNHPDVAAALNNLGELLAERGDRQRAEPLLRRALEIREKSFGQNHVEVAVSRHNLASVLAAEGKYADAESQFELALDILRTALGPDDPEVAITVNNLGLLKKQQNDFVGAELLFRQAVAIQEKGTPDHPALATTLYNLASVLVAQGRRSEAEPLARRALNIDEQLLGVDHPKTQFIRRNVESLGFSDADRKSNK